MRTIQPLGGERIIIIIRTGSPLISKKDRCITAIRLLSAPKSDGSVQLMRGKRVYHCAPYWMFTEQPRILGMSIPFLVGDEISLRADTGSAEMELTLEEIE